MTPVTLLAVFCSVMAAVAVAQFAIEENRDRIDAGKTLLVVGIAAFALVWANVSGSWFPTILSIALSVSSLFAIGIGLVLITYG